MGGSGYVEKNENQFRCPHLKVGQVERELGKARVEDAPGTVAECALRLRVDVVHLGNEDGRELFRALRKSCGDARDYPKAEEALKMTIRI